MKCELPAEIPSRRSTRSGRAFVCLCAWLWILLWTGLAAVAAQQDSGAEPRNGQALGNPGELPWERPAQPGLLPHRLADPRELLGLLGIDSSQFAMLADGEPFSDEDREVLIKLLDQLPKFNADDLDRWTQPLNVDDVLEDPDEHRGRFYRVAGRVVRVGYRELLPEQQRRFQFDGYYEVEVKVEGEQDGVRAVIHSRRLPAAWPVGVDLDERIRSAAMFVKRGPDSNPPGSAGERGPDGAMLYFAADRIGWYPESPRPSWNVGDDIVRLAEAGVDISWLDDLREVNNTTLGNVDREPFYQIMAALPQLSDDPQAAEATHDVDLAQLLSRPQSVQGQLVRISGHARRITRVVVDDATLQDRFALEEYYQIDMFVPLGAHTVQLATRNSDDDAPVFSNTYPVTVCTRRLPRALQEAWESRRQDAGEALLDKPIRVWGVFFKLQALQSDYVSDVEDSLRQPTPLILAAEVHVSGQGVEESDSLATIAVAVFAMSIAVCWGAVWWFGRSDRRASRALRGRRTEPLPDANPPGEDGSTR